MQIVIDIPNGAYKEITTANFPIQDGYRLVAWIKNGTPLPQGHGRLIDVRDAELAKFTLPQKGGDDYEYASAWNEAINAIIENAPTIVKSDGEISNG